MAAGTFAILEEYSSQGEQQLPTVRLPEKIRGELMMEEVDYTLPTDKQGHTVLNISKHQVTCAIEKRRVIVFPSLKRLCSFLL